MDKKLLIRHIKGEATPSEREVVVAWIDKSEQNEAYYIKLMNTIVAEDISRNDPSVGLSRSEISNSYSEIKRDIQPKRRVAFLKQSQLPYIAAAAAVLLIVSVLLNIWQMNRNTPSAPQQELALLSPVDTLSLQTYYTENGVKGKVILPDSSVVWLNSGSSLSFPLVFEKDVRRVAFSGEGYFEVAKNDQSLMEVTTPKGMKITVLGTKFYICSYEDDTSERATLFSGLINVSKLSDGREVVATRTLKPQESVRFEDEGSALLTKKADTVKVVAWKRGELYFENTPMKEVINRLERWHGVDIVVKDSTILNHHFTAHFTSASIVQILDLMRFTAPIDYSVKENIVTLSSRK